MTKEETLYESLCKCDPRARLEYPTFKEFLECDEDFKRILNAMLEAMESYATDRLDSYKESLRSAIEKEIKYHEDTGPMAQESRSTEIGELKRFLLLLDSVEPKTA